MRLAALLLLMTSCATVHVGFTQAVDRSKEQLIPCLYKPLGGDSYQLTCMTPNQMENLR